MQNAIRFTRRGLLGWSVVPLALALGLGLPACTAAAPAQAPLVHIVLVHTNDIHGQVLPRIPPARGVEKSAPIGGLSRLAARIHSVRTSDEHVIVVDTGDWTQGTPEGALDDGLGVLQAIAAIGYDALCVGNHDLDKGVATLRAHLETAALPALLANVREKSSGARVGWALPWRIVQRGGLRIALVGLLTTATPEITHIDAQQLDFEDPTLALREARRELAGQFDLLIPVAHLGLAEARKLARENPDLPLIVSGHSHDALPEGAIEGSTLIVQTGSRAAALGRVDLWVSGGRVVRSTASLEELVAEPDAKMRVAEVDRICDSLAQRASEQLAQVAGTLAAPVQRRRELGSSSAGNWICDAMKAKAQVDIALHNKGGIRSDLAAGPVTRRDLYEFLPFDNEMISVSMTGSELEACMHRAFEDTSHKGLEFSGMRAFVRRDKHGAVRLERLEVDGRELEMDREYRVVTNSFLAEGGDGLVELKRARRLHRDPMLQRELMELLLSSAGSCSPMEDQRVVNLDVLTGTAVETSAKK